MTTSDDERLENHRAPDKAALPGGVRLAGGCRRCFPDEAARRAHLERLTITGHDGPRGPARVTTEGALWGAIAAHGLLAGTATGACVVLSGDAGQFNVDRRLTRMTDLLPSVPEIRYLLARILLRPPTSAVFIVEWSYWRRRHQANAAVAHYKRQLQL